MEEEESKSKSKSELKDLKEISLIESEKKTSEHEEKQPLSSSKKPTNPLASSSKLDKEESGITDLEPINPLQ